MAAAKSGKNSVKIPGSGCGISSESNGFSMCLSTKFSCEIRFCVVFFAIILLTNKVKNALLDENLKKTYILSFHLLSTVMMTTMTTIINVPEVAWLLRVRMQLTQQDSQYVAQEYQVQLKPATHTHRKSQYRQAIAGPSYNHVHTTDVHSRSINTERACNNLSLFIGRLKAL